MKMIIPDSTIDEIKNILLTGVQHKNYSKAINTLELAPHLAHDDEIRKGMYASLKVGACREAKILAKINDPVGIDHLVYQALSYHPIHKKDRTQISGWSDKEILRCYNLLSKKHISLLIEDMEQSPHFPHLDILSVRFDSHIQNKMISFLQESRRLAVYAAYVLAMNGNNIGRDLLIDCANQGEYVDLAVIALSHIPNEDVLFLFEWLVDSENPLYKIREGMASETLLPMVQMRLELLEGAKFQNVFESYYRRCDKGCELSQLKLCVPIPGGMARAGHTTYGPDFLAEFASEEERNACCSSQKYAIEEYLSISDLSDIHQLFLSIKPYTLSYPPEAMIDNYYLPGVVTQYSEVDVINMVTAWILRPEDFRFGSGQFPSHFDLLHAEGRLLNSLKPE